MVLVIAASEPRGARSLAEKVARVYAENMQKLTEKFSQRNWKIEIYDGDDLAFQAGDIWLGLETGNMAIITNYRSEMAQDEQIRKIREAANPLMLLVNLDEKFHPENLKIFDKAVSVLVQGVDAQYEQTHSAVIQTRQENPWKEFHFNFNDPEPGSEPGNNIH